MMIDLDHKKGYTYSIFENQIGKAISLQTHKYVEVLAGLQYDTFLAVGMLDHVNRHFGYIYHPFITYQ